MTNCPACDAPLIPDDFPTASQGPITDKYECGSEYYDDYIVYPCGYKPFELPKTNLNDPTIKDIIRRLSKC